MTGSKCGVSVSLCSDYVTDVNIDRKANRGERQR